MQGRLLPPQDGKFQCFPREGWDKEITLAEQVPFDGIEWIYDLQSEGINPIETDAGQERLRILSKRSHMRIRSLCADYFMDLPLVRVVEDQRRHRLQKLRWLIARCGQMAIERIVLPFVDQSRIETADEINTVVASIRELLSDAEKHRIELHLETSLPPESFAQLLSKLEHPLVKANFDCGNSASLGYDPRAEFRAYGARVGSVHIKDRVHGGKTVPLGTGAVAFHTVRECLKEVAYDRGFILQAARGDTGSEMPLALSNRQFILEWWGSPVFKSAGSDDSIGRS